MKMKKGFTLIELLVVIAIIALLLAIVMPSLKTAKELAASIICMSNQKQLSYAWILYAEDNDSKFCDAATRIGPGGNGKLDSTHWCWVAHPQDENGNERSETLDDKYRGFRRGALGKYLSNPKVYHCPADKRYLTRNSSGQMMGYRSYSIGTVYSQRDNPSGGQGKYVIEKTSEIKNPSAKFVFLEETEGAQDPDAAGIFPWNNNTWDVNIEAQKWGDPLAANHNGSSTFGFADAHAEKRKWTQKWTILVFEKGWKGEEVVYTGGVCQDGESHPECANGTEDDYWWVLNAYIPGDK